jgi:hypothetical protein
MTAQSLPYQADVGTLAKACGAALLAGALILGFVVLPAEYNIDPTGAGKALGLTALSDEVDDTPEAQPATAVSATAVKVSEQTRDTIIRATPYRSDEKTLTLAPHSGVEVKAQMKAGDQFVFSWKSTAPVKMDMHGEASLTASDFSTYWKQKGLSEAQGSFTAPFDGIHGWYWRNQGDAAVTITLKTSGFYEKLIEPPVE